MSSLRRFIPSLVVFLLRALASTLRFRIDDRCGFTRGEGQPLISALWHNRLLVGPVVYSRFCRGRHAYCLTSPSKDGAIIAGVMGRFNIGSVRGSSSQRGATALRELAAVLEKGADVAITPDGPRGPKYRLNPGIVKLSQLTGVPVMPVRIEYSSYWELKSWDAFRIPKPFSRVEIVFGPLHEISPTESDEAFEAERSRLETAMLSPLDAAAQPV